MPYQLADLFEAITDAVEDRTALVFGERRIGYRELDDRGNALARALRARGVGPGDHVGLHLYNGPEYLEAMLALFKLRAVPININFRFVGPEISYMIDNADLAGVISQPDLSQPLAAGQQQAAGNPWILLVPDGGEVASGLDAGDYEEEIAAQPMTRDFPPRSGEDLYIIYTGGTTGFPKGVMWRHEDLFFAGLQGGAPGGDPVESTEELVENARDEELALSILPAAPFIHGSTQFASWISLLTGGKVVLLESRSFDAAAAWDLVKRENLHTLSVVGDAMARPLLDALKTGRHDAEELMVFASAGAILSPSIQEELQALLPETLVMNNFGSTETGHQGSAYPDEDDDSGDAHRTFLMDEDNLVFDEEMQPLSPGSDAIGMLARGGRIPLGYYKDEQKTAERFIEVDGKRYVLPGDFARVRDDGQITVLGRGSVCINTGGEKVFPEEVEEVLKGHPDVFDALVVGVADARWMQRVVAVVQPRPGKAPTLEALGAHCRDQLAGYKVPRALSLVEEVRRQPSGKPDYAWAKGVASGDGP